MTKVAPEMEDSEPESEIDDNSFSQLNPKHLRRLRTMRKNAQSRVALRATAARFAKSKSPKTPPPRLKPMKLTAAQIKRARHMRSLIRRKSQGIIDYTRSKSRLTRHIIGASMRHPKKFARGGVPWFILTMSSLQIGNFMFMYKKMEKIKELEQKDWFEWHEEFNSNMFIFYSYMIREDCQLWRFYTYQFVHVGAGHLMSNIFFQICAGIPLEYIHGSVRILILYNSGVIVGSISAMVVTPSALLVGASGGDFCMIAAVLANVFLNCDSMKFLDTAILLVALFGFGAYETHQSILRSSAQNEVEISWAAHLGGAVTGLTLGLVVLRNEDKKWWESVLTAIFGIIFIIYLATSILIAIFIDESHYNNGTLAWKNMSDVGEFVNEIPGGSKMTETLNEVGQKFGNKLDEIGDILFKNR